MESISSTTHCCTVNNPLFLNLIFDCDFFAIIRERFLDTSMQMLFNNIVAYCACQRRRVGQTVPILTSFECK